MHKTTYATMATLIALHGAIDARADLLGDTISGVLEAPNVIPGDNLFDNGIDGGGIAPVTAVVGAGAEFEFAPIPGGLVCADFHASTLDIVFDFDGFIGDVLVWTFTGIDGPDDIARVTILSSSFEAFPEVSFDANSITITTPNQVLDSPSATFNIEFVPAPSTVLLVASGAMLGVRRRRV